MSGPPTPLVPASRVRERAVPSNRNTIFESHLDHVGRRRSTPGADASPGGRPRWHAPAVFAAVLCGISLTGLAAAWLLASQGATAASLVVRLVTATALLGWVLQAMYGFAGSGLDRAPLRSAAIHLALLLGGSLAAEAIATWVSPGLALCLQLTAALASVWFTFRTFQATPIHRLAATEAAGAVATVVVVWFLARHGWTVAAFTVGGIAAMGFGFLLGLAAVRRILAGPGAIAVARTVVDEAVRMRVTLVLAILVILSLPILPLLLDSSERLSYRVQFLLTWALGGTGFLLSLMTVFLGCGSLNGDIDSSRIHLTLTKPLGRAEYLFGKWLGLATVNLLLVLLAGGGVYTLTRILAAAEANNDADRRAVDEQVLTSRLNVLPKHPSGAAFDKNLDSILADLEKEIPDAFRTDPVGTRARIRDDYYRNWYSLKPDRVGEFVFDGLADAKRKSRWVHLRIRPYGDVPGIDHADVKFTMWLNGRPYPYVDNEHKPYLLPGGITHTLELPSEAIDDEGKLRVSLANKNLLIPGASQPVWITMRPGTGLQLLEKVGGFEPNFLWGLLIMWLKLVLIAAVAITAATFLGFPMAVLTSLLVFISAFGSSYIGDSLEFSTGLDSANATFGSMARLRWLVFNDSIREGNYWEAFKTVMAVGAEAILWFIPSFDRYDGVADVAGGMQISGWKLLDCILRVGVVGPLALGLFAWALFENRDLVRSNT